MKKDPYAAAVKAATDHLAEEDEKKKDPACEDDEQKKDPACEDDEKKPEDDDVQPEPDPTPAPAPAPEDKPDEDEKPGAEEMPEDDDEKKKEDDKTAALVARIEALEASNKALADKLGKMQATLRNPGLVAAQMTPTAVPAGNAASVPRITTKEAAEAAYSKLKDPRKQAAFRDKYRALLQL